jgi:hypothetical protein
MTGPVADRVEAFLADILFALSWLTRPRQVRGRGRSVRYGATTGTR